jgi:hypothetical protein
VSRNRLIEGTAARRENKQNTISVCLCDSEVEDNRLLPKFPGVSLTIFKDPLESSSTIKTMG